MRESTLAAGDNRIGEFTALDRERSARLRAEFQPSILQLLIDFGLLLAGLYFLLLPPSISEGTAFRWLGALLFGRGAAIMCEFYGNYGPLNVRGSIPVGLFWVLATVCFVSTVEFPYALFRRPMPGLLRCLECVLALGAIPLPFSHSKGLFWGGIWLLAAMVPIPVAAVEIRRRTAGAGLTLFLFAVFGLTTLNNFLGHVSGIGLPLAIHIAGSRLWLWDAALLLWMPAISMQVHKINQQFRKEQERLRRQMEAARHVQRLLLPSQSLQIPSFEIDAHYQPAMEVGGDFFQLFPASADSLIVVVGDVSGKGMQAALVVSLLVGALQNRHSDAPAALLQELNTILLGRSEGGFTTCCCARFAPDGTVTLANAGHVAPYRDGEEVAFPPGFPLGLTAEATWEEIQIQLRHGERLLWVSDGVIEARNSEQELFGFQRTQELADRPASEIVGAAQAFGQEDDIAVLSITRQKGRLGVATVQ